MRSFSAPEPLVDGTPLPDERAALARVLAIVHQRTGADFADYRAGTIARRVSNRMISVGAASVAEYLPLLEASPGEAQRLLERLTIKVSRFYRNRRVFDLLRSRVLPQLAAACGGAPLRVWSAGCGRGEEAWTLAMLLAELDVDGEVIATDIDRSALAIAHAGRYAASAVAELPAALAARYVHRDAAGADHVVVTDALRARMRFLPHDVLAGLPPPGPRFQLIACRNLLIYMQPALQQRVLYGIESALAGGGVLVLGEAEWIPAGLTSRLAVIDAPGRLFRSRLRRSIEGHAV